jgi:hypothetical protein
VTKKATPKPKTDKGLKNNIDLRRYWYSSNLYYGPAWGFHSDEQKYIIGMSLSPRELLADRDYQKDLRTAIYYIAAEVKLKRTN